MIDYEKLKIAHELAFRTSYVIDTSFGMDELWFKLRNVDEDANDYEVEREFDDLDKLINALEKATKPKFKVGDKVWYLNADKEIESLEVLCSQFTSNSDWLYQNGKGWSIYEKACYPTKALLIDAQLEYWEDLRNDIQRHQPGLDVDRCQHAIAENSTNES